MGGQISAQIFPCFVKCENNRDLLSSWAWPNRVGMGRDDFCYSYDVPPNPLDVEIDQESLTKNEIQLLENTRQKQYFISEGKLTFHEYTTLVKALHNGSLLNRGLIQNMCKESWVAYDPFTDGKRMSSVGFSDKHFKNV